MAKIDTNNKVKDSKSDLNNEWVDKEEAIAHLLLSVSKNLLEVSWVLRMSINAKSRLLKELSKI